MFFDGFGESNKFGEKSRIKCRDIQQTTPYCSQDVLWGSSRWRSENVFQGTSKGGWFETSLGRQIRTSLGHYIETSQFIGYSGVVGWGRPRDVLGTKVYWLVISIQFKENNISKILQWISWKKSGLNGYANDFSVDYNTIEYYWYCGYLKVFNEKT